MSAHTQKMLEAARSGNYEQFYESFSFFIDQAGVETLSSMNENITVYKTMMKGVGKKFIDEAEKFVNSIYDTNDYNVLVQAMSRGKARYDIPETVEYAVNNVSDPKLKEVLSAKDGGENIMPLWSFLRSGEVMKLTKRGKSVMVDSPAPLAVTEKLLDKFDLTVEEYIGVWMYLADAMKNASAKFADPEAAPKWNTSDLLSFVNQKIEKTAADPHKKELWEWVKNYVEENLQDTYTGRDISNMVGSDEFQSMFPGAAGNIMDALEFSGLIN